MIVQVTPQIWYGDKPSVREAVGKVGSVINVAHSIRKPYWGDLGKLDWRVWYFRLALPDREPVDVPYMRALQHVLDSIRFAGKFPLLCHCRAGGHRGPTAAMFAAWHLDGENGDVPRLDYWLKRMEELKPGFNKLHKHRVYRRTVIEFCRDEED